SGGAGARQRCRARRRRRARRRGDKPRRRRQRRPRLPAAPGPGARRPRPGGITLAQLTATAGPARPEMEHACQNVTLRFVVGGSLVAVQPIGPDSLPEPAGPAAGAAGSGRTGAALIRPDGSLAGSLTCPLPKRPAGSPLCWPACYLAAAPEPKAGP